MALTLSGDNGIVYANLNQDIRSLLMPKNWIINGMFDVWQRGTSQTLSGYGSDDRWVNYHDISNKTHTREPFIVGQTDVPNNPQYFSRTAVTSGGTIGSRTIKEHKIEDVRKLAGKTVTISFWAKANAPKNISIYMHQNFGVGGSGASANLGVQKFPLTTLWQKITKTIPLPSISGATIGTDSFTSFIIYFDAGSNFDARTDSLGNQSGTFDIANVSLVEGSVAVECQNQPYADVLRDCMRYYYKLKPNGSSGYGIISSSGYVGTTTTTTVNYIPLPVPMRIPPILDSYSALMIVDTVNGFSPSSINISDANSAFIASINAVTTGLTANNIAIIRQYNDVNGHIAFSAEL